MMTDAGTQSAVTDTGDGTYTATLTSATAVGTATLTFTVDGAAAPATATVSFTVGPADPDTSTITAAPPVIESDGEAASVITVTLFDAKGNPRGVGGSTITMSTTIGTLGAVTDNGDGTYTAALTSTTIGIATIIFTVDGISAPASATVTVQDTTPPTPPVITGPSDGAHVPPTFPITGTGEPRAIVEVRDGTGSLVCTAAVEASGAWTCFPGTPFPEGAATLTATQSGPLRQRQRHLHPGHRHGRRHPAPAARARPHERARVRLDLVNRTFGQAYAPVRGGKAEDAIPVSVLQQLLTLLTRQFRANDDSSPGARRKLVGSRRVESPLNTIGLCSLRSTSTSPGSLAITAARGGDRNRKHRALRSHERSFDLVRHPRGPG